MILQIIFTCFVVHLPIRSERIRSLAGTKRRFLLIHARACSKIHKSKRRKNMYQDNPFPKGSDCCKPCKLQLCIYQCIYVHIYGECIHKHVNLQIQCIFLKSLLYNRFFSYLFTRPLLSLIHYKNLCPCY